VETAKNWIYDHGDGSAAGGCMVIQTSGGAQEFHGDILLHQPWAAGHGMSIIGYSDSIGWDYNGDGSLTNPGEDVLQWEKGAWKCIDASGMGPYWLPYREIPENQLGVNEDGGECGGDYMILCRPKKDYKPVFTFKISVSHNQRNQLKLETGVANSLGASEPEFTKDYSWAFNFTAGPVPMGGSYQTEEIEIGLDLTDLLEKVTSEDVTFFLKATSNGGSGQIKSLTLMDYTGGDDPAEISCPQSNVGISGTILMSVPLTGVLTSGKLRQGNSNGTFKFAASPNPVRRHTNFVQFSFSGKNIEPANLHIMDTFGRTVFQSSFTANLIPPGISWNLLNNNGVRVSPGTYIASITLGTGRLNTCQAVRLVILSE
jgi:hypothetical protein